MINSRINLRGRDREVFVEAGRVSAVDSWVPKNSSREDWGMRNRPCSAVPRLAFSRPSFKYLYKVLVEQPMMAAAFLTVYKFMAGLGFYKFLPIEFIVLGYFDAVKG